jgi:L-aminopeptidase/D-esterase-like protein
MVIYDLGVGDPSRRPGSEEGYAACLDARSGAAAVGRGAVGAGTGATVGKWAGPSETRPAGIGSAVVRHDGLVVASLMVVNALGSPRAGGEEPPRIWDPEKTAGSPIEATTIGVVVTNARLDKSACRLVAESAHDGLARALDPVHTAADGDAVVAAATGEVEASVHVVRSLAAWVVERAVLDGAGGQAVR